MCCLLHGGRYPSQGFYLLTSAYQSPIVMLLLIDENLIFGLVFALQMGMLDRYGISVGIQFANAGGLLQNLCFEPFGFVFT